MSSARSRCSIESVTADLPTSKGRARAVTRVSSGTLAAGATMAAAVALLSVSAITTSADAGGTAPCKARLINRAVHYCGPATARLSVFPGVTFRHGQCRHQTLKSGPLLSVGLGVRTQNSKTNNGQPYFGLTISGKLSKPTGGGVIAYANGKRWGGRGVSFKATAGGGTFVVRGISGSRGTATGRFDC